MWNKARKIIVDDNTLLLENSKNEKGSRDVDQTTETQIKKKEMNVKYINL